MANVRLEGRLEGLLRMRWALWKAAEGCISGDVPRRPGRFCLACDTLELRPHKALSRCTGMSLRVGVFPSRYLSGSAGGSSPGVSTGGRSGGSPGSVRREGASATRLARSSASCQCPLRQGRSSLRCRTSDRPHMPGRSPHFYVRSRVCSAREHQRSSTIVVQEVQGE